MKDGAIEINTDLALIKLAVVLYINIDGDAEKIIKNIGNIDAKTKIEVLVKFNNIEYNMTLDEFKQAIERRS